MTTRIVRGSIVTAARLTSGALALCGALATSSPADGIHAVPYEPLLAGDAAEGDEFGTAVSMRGARAAVGAPLCDEGAIDAGAVYFFERVDLDWVQGGKLTSPSSGAGDRFGSAVDQGGGLLVVGAPGAQGLESASGLAHVFTWNGVGWELSATLVAADGASGDGFGTAVAVRGSEVFVGAPLHALEGNAGGAVYRFTAQGGSWIQQEVFQGSDTTGDDRFGGDLDAAGGVLVVGAYGRRTAGSWSGGAYLFEETGGAWTETALLIASDAGVSQLFGLGVAVDGERVAIGARGDSTAEFQSGAVYLFQRSGGGWQGEAKLKSSPVLHGARFGGSLSLEGRTLAIGARWDPTAVTNAGAVYVFLRGELGWKQEQRILASQPGFNDWLGESVELDDGDILAGAPRSDSPELDSGAVHSWRIDPGETFCFGDGTARPCPCGNVGSPGRGCAHSGMDGALLIARGSSSATEDDLRFTALDLLPDQPAWLFAGTGVVAGGDGRLFGDGLRCAHQNLRRLGMRVSTPGGGASWGPELGVLGEWGSGETRYFQVWYRDVFPSPCGSDFNTTNAYRVTFGY